MAKPKNIILTEDGVITQEALLAYAEGRLSADEAGKLEKLLSADPFAQDALEGIRSTTAPAEMRSVITSLNVQLREKTGAREKKKKGIEIHWATYAYAAMIVGVLIGLGFVMIHFIADNDQRIAMNKTVPQAQESTPIIEEQAPVPPPDTTHPAAAVITLSDADSMRSSVIAAPPAGGAGADAPKTPGGDLKLMAPAASQPAAPKPETSKNTNNVKADDLKRKTEGELKDKARANKKKEKKEEATVTDRSAPPAEPASRESDLQSVSVTARKMPKQDAAPVNAKQGSTDKLKAARILFDGGDFKAAGKLYGDILSDQPDNSDALYFGGICEFHNGKNRQAEKSFDKLLKAGMFTDGSKWYKANVLIERGKKEEARQLLRDLINTNSSFKDRAVKKYEEIVK